MRVLAIAPEPFFTPRGTPLSVYYRTLVSSELGLDVDLLTYGQGADVDIPRLRIVRIPRFRWLGPVKVGPSLLKAFLDVWLLLWALGMMVRNRYDIVHAHEESVFFCRFLKPVFRFKLVYDMHSILSQQLVNFRFTRSRLLIGTFRRLEDGCLSAADAIITISPALAAYAVERVREADRHFLIENSLFDPVRLRDGRIERDLTKTETAGVDADWLSLLDGDRPVVLYAGTFESYQGIELLLRAFALLRRDAPSAFLLLLGGRPEQVARHRALAAELGLGGDDCRFAGQVERDLAQRATREAAVLTSPRIVGSNTPLKIYEQMASGVPLVATRIGSHTQVLDDDSCILVAPEPQALAAGLAEALGGGPAVQARVEAARRLYEEGYAPAVYRDKLRRLFERVTR